MAGLVLAMKVAGLLIVARSCRTCPKLKVE